MKKTGIILSVILTAFASCSKQIPTDEVVQPQKSGALMSITSTVESTYSVDGYSPAFIFWFGKDYPGIASPTGDSYPQPYFVSYPSGEIDDYKDVPYNTGRTYPGAWIYVNGFSPACLTVKGEANNYDWRTLYVPESEQGRHDIMTVYGTITGNAERPLHTNSKILTFRHINSKVDFYAKLGDNVAAGRYFKGVTVEVDGAQRFTRSLTWDINGTTDIQADDCYRAGEKATESTLWSATDPNTNQMDENEYYAGTEYPDYRPIGSVYLHPGESEITFNIYVTMSDTPLFTTSDRLQTTATVQFIDKSTGAATTLDEGERYEIFIDINYDAFAIRGNKGEWEQGDNLIIPIVIPSENQ